MPVRESLKRLGRVAARQRVHTDHLWCPPITYDDVHSTIDVEPFHVLQGDIIRSDAAYVLGTRHTGNQSYVIATSTRDLVPGRRQSALLLPLEPRSVREYVSHQKL